MPATIKIFGERNTSTNALKALIEANSASRVAPSVAGELDAGIGRRLADARAKGLPLMAREAIIDQVFAGRSALESWKHTTTDFDDIQPFAGCHVIICLRHPASWLLGLWRHPYHIPAEGLSGPGDLLRLEWQTVARERLGGRMTNALALYNVKTAAWLGFRDQLLAGGMSCSIVRHEDFAVDQQGVFDRLSPYLLDPVEHMSAIEDSTKKVGQTRDHYADYYGKERWRDEIAPEVMDAIAKGIDWSRLTQFGYCPDHTVAR